MIPGPCPDCLIPEGHRTSRCPNLPKNEKCGKFCRRCADIPSRREKPDCPACEKPWEPEVLIHELPTPSSGCHGF